jgi:hypothetical protein
MLGKPDKKELCFRQTLLRRPNFEFFKERELEKRKKKIMMSFYAGFISNIEF